MFIEEAINEVTPALLIVPDALHNAINTAIDKALIDAPDAAKDRDIFYNQLLTYWHVYGSIPDFQLTKRVEP